MSVNAKLDIPLIKKLSLSVQNWLFIRTKYQLVPGADIQKNSHKEKHGMRLRSLLYVISKTY